VRTAALLIAVGSICLLGGPASAHTLKGDGPRTIATGYGSVWVGTGSGFVVRINPRTNRVIQRIDVSSPLSVQRLVPAYGSMWVATSTSLPRRIDARTGRVRMIWARDWCTAPSIAVVAGRVWVLDGLQHRLCEIDPSRNRLRRNVQLAWKAPLHLWSDGSRLWLAVNADPKPPMVEDNLERVRQIALDPHTGSPLGPAIDTAGWTGFSAGFGSLWAMDPITRTLARFDPFAGRLIATSSGIAAGAAPVSGFGSLWLAGGERVQRFDPVTLAPVAEVPLPASMLAVGSGAVWALSSDGTRGIVRKIDPRTNRVVGRPIAIRP
jgi:hypothetical protein